MEAFFRGRALGANPVIIGFGGERGENPKKPLLEPQVTHAISHTHCENNLFANALLTSFDGKSLSKAVVPD